jgi:hypothetical protein
MPNHASVRAGIALAFTLVAPSAFAQDLSSGGPASLSGTWTVTGTPSASNKADCADLSLAYQWIVSVQSDGAASVTVQGETGFPSLRGRVSGSGSSASLSVSGLKLNTSLQGISLYESSEFKLSGTGGSLSGTRIWGGYGKATDSGLYPTFCSWSVTARKL